MSRIPAHAKPLQPLLTANDAIESHAMAADNPLREFFEAAKQRGTADETLVGLLRGRGWSDEAVYHALADDYESRSGIKVPVYKPSGSAKDAFLYLVSFSTLATWTIALGSIMFTLIDRWIKDPLSPANTYASGYYQMANSISSVIVAFPVYLLVTRHIVRESEIHPEKLESAVRKWLTYIALFVAASVVVGDLITFLTYFLRGELTARFATKVADVLVIAGGIFWYYLGSMRRSAPASKHSDE
jgi:Domain of unknown function (DUF5671)